MDIKNLLNNNKKYLGYIDITDLYKLEIKIPTIQRLSYEDKIRDIVNYQEEYFKKNKTFNFLGVLNLINFQDKVFIIDGQHRYKALLELYRRDYRNEEINIEIIKVKNLREMKDNYELLNKNTPLPEFEFGNPEQDSIHNEVLKYFLDRYSELFSIKTRINRPKISRIRFEETLEYLINKLNSTDAPKLIQQIEDVNRKMINWKESNFPDLKCLSNPEKILKECKTWKFYLGMFKYNNQEYNYDWVKTIIKTETGEDIMPKTQKRKKNIPKKIKNEVWDKYIGKELGISKCQCCKKTDIYQNQFHAGHFISEANGGKVKVDNLRPICAGCNLSMGKKNMDEYIKEYY